MRKELLLFKAGSFYPGAIEAVYERNPALTGEPYERQLRELMDDGFHWADFWQRHLENGGQFKVMEVVANAESLQKKWAEEHGVSYRPSSWQSDILLAQVKACRPDILFQHGAVILPREFREAARRACPYTTYVDYDGVARNSLEGMQGSDGLLSCLRSSVSFYQDHGLPAHYFKLGFESSILDRLGPRRPVYDVSFVGGLWLSKQGHGRRLRFLSEVSRHIPLTLHLLRPSNGQYWRSVAGRVWRGRVMEALGGVWREFPHLRRLNRIAQGPLYGLRMYRALRDSKITLNCHIDAANGRAANFRLFEATGAGTCLVTDWQEDLNEYFEVDREVVTFRSIEECVEKIRYLLDHDKEREEIARRGQERTLKDHRLDQSILSAGEWMRSLVERKRALASSVAATQSA